MKKSQNNILIVEGGLRDINSLAKRYQKAEIYFHMDLDGVASALCMKKYLESNNIKVVDVHVIQYGDKEFAVKKVDAEGDTMPVLVDFSHGKPMFVIHTDHHQEQTGTEETQSKSFRGSKSNAETISQIISPQDIFSPEDVKFLSMIDSADYSKYNVTPEEVINYVFSFDKEQDVEKNKMKMALVVNKLILAFKNKKGFLDEIVMTSSPSIISLFQNIRRLMKESGYSPIEKLEKNKEDYITQMKSSPNVKVEDKIIVQYGGGNMMNPGSYDRYVPFKNNPDADFLVIAWPLGLVQASKNPFKEKEGVDINLGEIAQEVISKWESQLKERIVPLSTIKWISEFSKDLNPSSVGFTFKDFTSLYGDKFKTMEGGGENLWKIKELMSKQYKDLSEEEWGMLDKIGVTAWQLIQSSSGGHKDITNISGLNYLGRSKRPPQGTYKYDPNKDDAPYIKFIKMVQNEFVKVLTEKMEKN